MTTYGERLNQLDTLIDKETIPIMFKKYMTEAREIRKKLKLWPNLGGVEPTQHIEIKIKCDSPDCTQAGIYLVKITNQSISQDLISAAIVTCKDHFDQSTRIAYRRVN